MKYTCHQAHEFIGEPGTATDVEGSISSARQTKETNRLVTLPCPDWLFERSLVGLEGSARGIDVPDDATGASMFKCTKRCYDVLCFQRRSATPISAPSI